MILWRAQEDEYGRLRSLGWEYDDITDYVDFCDVLLFSGRHLVDAKEGTRQ